MELRIISLNTFGAPFFSKSISKRFGLIAETFNKEQPDIICLQEVVLYQHLKLLKATLKNYPYCSYKRFLLGPKGGLVIFSKLPVESTVFFDFTDRGSLRNKSVVGRIMRFGILGIRIKDAPITIFTTHLIPNSDGVWTRNNRFTKYLQSQLFQLSGVIADERRWKRDIILAGDFNIQPDTFLYEEFLKNSGLTDIFTANRGITRHESPAENLEAQTIDFIFHSSQVKQLSTAYIFQSPLRKNGNDFYLSNHIGLMAQLQIEENRLAN